MNSDAVSRAMAYVNAFTDIVLALGWGCDVQWWLCKPDGAQ